jgi:hypothetical protein
VITLRGDHLRHEAAVIGTLAHSLAGAAGPVQGAHRQDVVGVLTDLLDRLAGSGQVRSDLDPALLAGWLLHAVHAPADLDDEAVARLVAASLSPRP